MSDSNSIDWDITDDSTTPDEPGFDIYGDLTEGEPEAELSTELARNPEDEVAILVQNDSEGNEVVSEINFSSPALTEAEAKEITERIKTTTNVLYLLVKRAHAGKAYKALGYNTFEAYIKEEFSFSKVYAYRLLSQANFIAAIEERVPEGTEVRVSEPVSKKLKHVLPELLEEVSEKTEGLAADDAGAVIEDIIRERREEAARVEAEEAALAAETGTDFGSDDFGDEEGSFTGSGQGTYVDDFDDEDTVEFVDEDESILSEDSVDVRRKFDKLYNLYTGLKNINGIGDGDELISFVPPERLEEFNGLLETAIPWMEDFHNKLKQHRTEEESAPADEEISDAEENSDDFE